MLSPPNNVREIKRMETEMNKRARNLGVRRSRALADAIEKLNSRSWARRAELDFREKRVVRRIGGKAVRSFPGFPARHRDPAAGGNRSIR